MEKVGIRLSLEDHERVKAGLRALGAEGQQALARIERQGRPASRSLLAVNAATGELAAGFTALGGRLGAVGAGLSAIGPAGVAAAAGIAGVSLAIASLARASVQSARDIATIGDEAQQAGAAVEVFQELSFAAQRFSVTNDALVDGLKELNLRADEFVVTGGGSAAEAFERIGFTQADLQSRLGDTGALFREVVARIAEVDDAAARIRLADEIFGGQGGEQFVRLINAGAGALDELAQEARSLGIVLDAQVVAQADATRDRLDVLSRVIDINLDAALVNIAPLIMSVVEGLADLAVAGGRVVDLFRDLDNRSTGGLEDRLADLQATLAGGRFRGGAVAADGMRADIAAIEEILAARRATQLASEPIDAPRGATGADQEQAEAIDRVTESLRFQIEQLDRTAVGRRVFQELQRAGIDADRAEALTIAGLVIDLQRAEDAESALQQARQDAQRLTEGVATAEEERAARLEQVNDLLRQGLITEQTAARVRAQAAEEAAVAERERLDASREAADGSRRALQDIAEEAGDAAAQTERVWRSATQGMENALVSFVQNGRLDFSALADSIISDLIRIQVQQSVTRPLAGFLGDLFSSDIVTTDIGTFHSGGTVGDPGTARRVPASVFANAPRFHMGGRIGPREVPIIAERGERVLTEAQQANTAATITALSRAAGGAAQAPAVTVTVNNSAPGAEARAEVTRNDAGGLDLVILVDQIEQQMGRNMATGRGLAPVVEGRYGLNPAAGARR